ncbi:hypothetical protein [Vreelandella neptunia]|uniref:Uncharacterized protein n=1 Tax=Vreelandella neptunia TaxID=115551 RepID=A0ABS9S9Q5_9GAMM|nr:hypothetical protein [Halomonas neptunia]MCH4812841.1 hypothetical protein [Halomonas neptunia]
MNIKVRVLGAIVVSVIGGLVVASEQEVMTPEEYCNTYFNSTVIMELRQESIKSQKSEVSIISKSHYNNRDIELVNTLVEEAFRFPYTNDYSMKNKFKKEFKQLSIKNCLDYKKDKAI